MPVDLREALLMTAEMVARECGWWLHRGQLYAVKTEVDPKLRHAQ